MQPLTSITAFGSVSPLGKTASEVRNSYLSPKHFIKKIGFDEETVAAQLSANEQAVIKSIKEEHNRYRNLDNSVLFAMYAARQAVRKAGWKTTDNFGVNFGSSRGATQLFEKFYTAFLKFEKTSALTSPTTTLGNIASWVAQDLKTQGPEISHSITCSTSLHALLNGVAWIRSGLTDKFVIGGSEAALTPFTISQMKALKIYADANGDYPCRALEGSKKKNTMVLGEGAAAICLESGKADHALAFISGIGYATEVLKNNTSISTEAHCFQRSMKMALNNSLAPEEIDIVITHTPGTIQGDMAERIAIEKFFGKHTPYLTTNKWKMGHTFGASGALSLEMALLMLINQEVYAVPYLPEIEAPKSIKNILINAVGFGGNAVSVLLSK